MKSLDSLVNANDMLVCNGYKFHAHTPEALLPYGVVLNGFSSEFSVEEVGYYLETMVCFKVDVVCLVNIAEDKWILRARMWSNALDAKDVTMSLLIEACQFDASNVVYHMVRWIVPFLRRRRWRRW